MASRYGQTESALTHDGLSVRCAMTQGIGIDVSVGAVVEGDSWVWAVGAGCDSQLKAVTEGLGQSVREAASRWKRSGMREAGLKGLGSSIGCGWRERTRESASEHGLGSRMRDDLARDQSVDLVGLAEA